MKEVKAYIKPSRLIEVTAALHKVKGLTGMSFFEVKGFGRRHLEAKEHGKNEDVFDYIVHVRVDVLCKDELADTIVDTIRKAAHTGLRGDGKIYVSDVGKVVRISTGEVIAP